MPLSSLLLATYPIISDQVDASELKILLDELEQQLRLSDSGAVVEFGCYAGTSSLFIQRMIQSHEGNYVFHVYDSFEGLPEKGEQDSSPAGLQFVQGELNVSKSRLIQNFKKARLPLPRIHKGWFENLTADDVPSNILFAFLDGDYYKSVQIPLRLIWNKLAEGAVIIIDDYQNEALPGAAKAVDEWVANRSLKSFRVASSLAILRP